MSVSLPRPVAEAPSRERVRTAPGRKPRGRARSIPMTILGCVFLAIMVFPVYWMINTSLQSTQGAATATWFPWSPSFRGYETKFCPCCAIAVS